LVLRSISLDGDEVHILDQRCWAGDEYAITNGDIICEQHHREPHCGPKSGRDVFELGRRLRGDEFDHERFADLAKFAKDRNLPTQQHIYSVVRTPSGNDSGKDLPRQHYLTHSHQA